MTQQQLDDAGTLVLRGVVAGLMLFHGVDKLIHGPGHVQADLVHHGLPGFLAYGVYVGEVLAPIFILAGAWTRLWAAVYALSIASATVLVHGGDFLRLAPTGAWAAELWVFYMTGPIVVALLGPGRYALRPGNGPWD
jgi:putative oxidoreductase